MKEKTSISQKLQKFGSVLAGMVIPNIGAFIGFGLITAFFLETGWTPNAKLAKLISPILNYLLPILIGHTVSTLRDVSQEELYLNLLSGFELAGVISLYPPTKIAQANALSKQVPVVSIGDKPDACRFDAVELDSKKPGYIIAEHLLSLGHKHITYICTPIRPKEIGRIHRLAGLRSCFKDHGLDPEWVEVKSPTIAAYGRYSADNSEYQNGYDMASQALDEHTSSTAFVGNNDMTAFGIMAAISDHGFRVPHDYSVCGFDNIPLSSMPQIALTTIEHASLAKGREAVDIIYKKNTQKNISAKHHYIMRMEYEPELIVRNSTGKCKITNKTKECHNIS